MKKKGVTKKEEKYEITVREGNISLVLDSYNDLFSGFDPRSYSQKSLSYDFLTECKRASIDKPRQGLDLRLLIPKNKRNLAHEIMIRKRLKEHFNKHFKEKDKEIKGIKKEGLIWFFVGVLVMLTATTFLYVDQPTFLQKFLLIMCEPAGWFMFWEGLDKIFITARERKPDYAFYEKMKNAKLEFFSY